MTRQWRFALMAGWLLLNGCAATGQARSVETSGFLHDLYPLMRKGHEGEGILVYRNPKVEHGDKTHYTKFMLDPVMIYRGAHGQMDGISKEQSQVMADSFYTLIWQQLSKDYDMVTQPGADTLRAQVAIVHAERSMPVLDIISTIPAPMNVLALGSAVKNLATGKPAFTGEASIEWKLMDSRTGEVFAAGVDRRVGKKKLEADSFNSWADVYDALKYWSEQTRYRLCQERGQRTDCVKPDV